MDYYELKQLKTLLNKYVKHVPFYDPKSVLYRMNKDLIGDMAIMVNKHLKKGEKLEVVIMRNVKLAVYDYLRRATVRSIKKKEMINPRDLKEQIDRVIRMKLKI